MRLNVTRVFIVAFLCAILVVGSFVTDNFGLSKAYVGWTSLPSTDSYGYPCTFECSDDRTLQAPYVQQSWSVDRNMALPPDTIALLLIAIAALILAPTYFLPDNKKYSLHSTQAAELLQPAWKVHFKKHKYQSTPTLKRHPRQYKPTARHEQG